LSFFARVNYNFKDRYLVSATLRADGSSKFSDGHRWGYFPSAAVAWRISDEPFMEKTRSWLDDLKFRISYGTAGNNNIPTGQNSRIWTPGSGTSLQWISGQSSYWTTGTHMANPDLTWETTITRNIGLDFTLFGGKLNGSAEYYWNTTKDLLIEFPVSGSGYNYQYQNLGETQNSGFEFSFTYHIVNKKDWGIDFTGNIGFNKNKVKSLGSLTTYNASSGWASTQIQNDYRVVVGEPVGQIYGYRNAGRYEVSDFDIAASKAAGTWVLKEGVPSDGSIIGTKYLRPGALKLQDINEDGVINDKDQTVIGNTNPKANGGFAINARAYGFDFAANFTYSIGNDVYNANKIEYTSSYQYKYRNMITEMASGKRWNNIAADGTLLDWNNADALNELNKTTTMWSPFTSYVLTDWAVENGSFLRLSTLTLGYTLPATLTKKAYINSLRFYFTCYNVFCLTGYSGFDPEVSTRNKTALTPGVDYSAYPKSRQFVFGLNLNF
ncbi:MAG: SusC/RagA family TonB-linked outer membrane protein, partial [Prevotella sp.]|nr:SusC/RagA family TonB-linked outer membrane protein [Prevotella sp.]